MANAPGVYSKFIDLSGYTGDTTPIGITAIFPIFSARGEDNVLKQHFDSKVVKKQYGIPNLKKFGQSFSQALTWVETGNIALICRLMPSDASYSNIVFSYDSSKANAADRHIVLGSYTNMASFSAIETQLKSVPTSKDDFLIFFAVGRGKDYDKLSISIKRDNSLNDTYLNFPCYTVTIYDKDSNGVDYAIPGESFTVSFDRDAVDVSGESLYIEDVVLKYSSTVFCMFDIESYVSIVKDKFSCSDEEVFTKDLFGMYPDLTDNRKCFFAEGSDGSLYANGGRNLNWNGFGTTAEENYLKSAKSLLIEFFGCNIDNRLQNYKETRANFIFDANYPAEVKASMDALTKYYRSDISVVCDTRLQANEDLELSYRNEQLNFDNPYVSIYGNNFEIYDKFSGRNERVTSSYKVVESYGYVKKKYGLHYPVAGYTDLGNITGISKLAYNPNPNYLESFYQKQINPIVKTPDGYYFMGNLTTQKKNSALQNISIVNMLQQIDIDLKYLSEKKLYSFITPEVLSEIKVRTEEYFIKWINENGLEKVEVNVYATELDKKRKRAQVEVTLYPTSILEQIHISFIVK